MITSVMVRNSGHFIVCLCVFKQGGLSRLIGQQSGYIQRFDYFLSVKQVR